MKASRSIILSVVMLCLCFMNIEIVHASSDDVTSKFTVDGSTYGILSGSKKVILLDYNNKKTTVNLRKKISYAGKKYTIVEIGSEAFAYSAIENITIPNTIISIGESAFFSCEKLESVKLPNSISRIEASTFKFCNNLKEINIPDSIRYVSKGAFLIHLCLK